MSKEKAHELESTVQNLKDLRKELDESAFFEISLTNLPTHFWETLGECINDIEKFIKKDNVNLR